MKKDEIKDTKKAAHYKTLTFDIEYYQSILDDEQIDAQDKQELLTILWNIAVSFVDLGYEIHPLQQVNQDSSDTLHPAITKMIEEAVNESFHDNEGQHTERSEA